MLGTTPMFKQYQEIKDRYEDAILFYRLGDFYEMFGPDAITASEILGLALTARDGGGEVKVPMCGVPFHSAEGYIAKLIRAGQKVAICEQTEDPKAAKGLVKREVIRIITPGMVIEDAMLAQDSNYMAAVLRQGDRAGMALTDISTGAFLAGDVQPLSICLNEIGRYHPVEIVYDESDEVLKEALEAYGYPHQPRLSAHYPHAFLADEAKERLLNHFEVRSLASFGYDDGRRQGLSMRAAGALMDYIYMMQRSKPLHITQLTFFETFGRMVLDRSTRRNLEIDRALGEGEEGLSLFDVLDHTSTAFGRRLLRQWLDHPLKEPARIQERLDATEELYHRHEVRAQGRDALRSVFDLERIVSRISFGSANAKDLLSLKDSMTVLPRVQQLLDGLNGRTFRGMAERFDTMADLYERLERAIHPDAPFSLREGGLIASGYHPEVDELRAHMGSGKDWISQFEQEERTRTGIKTLKVGYNRVFGYYIDVTRSHLDKVPETYVRKQTLANSERFITDNLKEVERRVLGASERLKELEYALFQEVRESLLPEMPRILQVAQTLATLDVTISMAECAIEGGYVKPTLVEDRLRIEGLRHPVVEKSLRRTAYTPNAVDMDGEARRFMILTGPNMSGKSTYCRSVALASIMMQIGSFVPAERAEMMVVDRVFARIGASDHLAGGQSTFMVEMNEVANILHYATKDSLIILDEVGRGTSTFDGLSIAYAITLHINRKIAGRTIFATHYHELTSLESEHGIFNCSVAVQDQGRDVIFLHTIVPGGSDRSYGIHVAKMAGLPEEVLAMADEVLRSLEAENTGELSFDESVIALREDNERMARFIDGLASTPLESLSVGDVLNTLLAWQAEAKAFSERA